MPFYRRFLPVVYLAALCLLFCAASVIRKYTDDAGHEEVRTDAFYIAAPAAPPVVSPLDIPEAASYTLRENAGTLIVSDDTGREVFRTALPDTAVLTDTDRAMLEREGYTYTARSELIEFLLVLETPFAP